MPGSASIGTNLVDSLLEVVDDLRDGLHTDMGVRQWRVYTRRRTWSGPRRGEGAKTDVDIQIEPQPFVSYDLRYELDAAGIDERGEVTLTEVSLTYTEAELTGRPLLDNEEWYFILRDAHGQEMADRWFVVAAPPSPDRVSTIGWVVRLRRVDVEDC
jgi:hypothetical protein